ncbi:MAG TPA: helix-turn-helix transcriptional regulator [Verrucomicrobiae bacterium]|nr:helix-turn-helix transcriptional regulator [Verrucomicrobiae bacterium]
MSDANRRLAVKVIGGAIREMREARGQTLEGLAADADISYQYLSGIETGKENFSIRILEKIAGALDISLVNLISNAYDVVVTPQDEVARAD